jgi:hypothetical protein
MGATVEAGMVTNVGGEEDGLTVAAEMDEDGGLDQAQRNKRERKKRKRKRRKIQKEKVESRSWMLPQHEHEQDHDSVGDGEEAALLALLAGQDRVAALDPSSTEHRAVGDEMTNFPSPPQQQQRDNRDNDKRGKKRKKRENREKREKRGESARAQQSGDKKRKKANKKQKQEEGTSMNKHSRRTTTQRAKKHDTNRYTMVHELD